MLDLSRHPLCADHLRLNRTNIDDPAMDAYWAALCVAEDYSDKRLTRHGGINFWTMDGPSLLDAMESFLASAHKDRASQLPKRDFERLKAYFGSQGFKTSKMGVADFWSAGRALWPDYVFGSVEEGLDSLLTQIDCLPKKLRRSLAAENRVAALSDVQGGA